MSEQDFKKMFERKTRAVRVDVEQKQDDKEKFVGD